MWAALPNRKASDPPAQADGVISEDGSLIKGLHYKTYRNGLLLAQAEAEDFKIVPRRFFVFRIKSLNEAVMTNAKISIFSRGESGGSDKVKAKENDPFVSLFRELTSKDSGAGLVTKVTVKGIDIAIYDSEVVTHRLNAATAELGSGGGQAIFYNAVLERPALRTRVSARKIIWDPVEKKFRIPGGRFLTSVTKADSRGKVLQTTPSYRRDQLMALNRTVALNRSQVIQGG